MAVSNKNIIDTMIQSIKYKDVKLYEILSLLSNDIGALMDDLRPIIERITAQEAVAKEPSPVFDLIATLSPNGVTLNWSVAPEDVATNINYEVRKGVDWDTAERVTKTAAFNVFLNPLPAGLHTYIVRAIGATGLISDITSVNFTVDNPGTLSLTANCIDNNVLLSWTQPTSTFRIDHYAITRGGIAYGNASSTFTTIFESAAGSYTYGVKAVDIAGNTGPESFITVDVKQPPDYVLVTETISDFSGTKSNCIADDIGLWAPVYPTKTFEQHFTDRGWDQINDQLVLGYDHYLEPAPTTGYYQEVVDFGSIFTNVIINLDWDFIELSGTVIVAGQIEVSDDGLSWSAPVAGVSVFATSCRYARVRLTFTGSDDDVIIITTFRILLDVKQEMDGGQVNALAADADGTVVTFNKAYKDVQTITVSCQSIEPLYPVYNFVDIPNPTQFKVLVFDSSGNRINYLVSWKARGVV